ncbi:MAG: proline--tRNA ligase [Gemmatimonas sp.]|uniref:proline--tRNA ligase n=1 Tax=Gemmatimonas sp. TaxID=1962908 RepID=UPI0031C94F13|nr:proline--tRNA ligase [Gemmatimonas sp.]
MSDDKKLTTRAENFSDWYNELVLRSELADYSPVRGCMVIRPHGYGIWERMQRALDDMFKATGHVNAYFPLFIPESFLSKEAEHVEGFAPECAVVTMGGGKQLEERLVVRPTSETIIYSMFAKWVQSYRDLPLLYNQWANVVRWEMRTRLFLRTMEFLWQEGHTAHASHDEAEAETRRMLGVYREFMEGYMAMPVITGQKTDSEKFAGALRTYACEALMQDNKALQAGTSHNLGQNFAKAFDLTFQSEAGQQEYAWNTSWGVSTRMIGGLVMTHGDDAGLRLPPKLTPIQMVIVPIWKTDEERDATIQAAKRIADELGSFKRPDHERIRCHVDDRVGIKPGAKYYHWELRGIPLRMEIGPRDLAQESGMLVRRDTREKRPIAMAALREELPIILDQIQAEMLAAARARLEANSIREPMSYEKFKEIMEGPGAFVYAGWNGDPAVEARVKEETKATIRCIPDPEFRSPVAPTACMVTGEPAKYEVLWARSY